jgi:hypothetical protein
MRPFICFVLMFAPCIDASACGVAVQQVAFAPAYAAPLAFAADACQPVAVQAVVPLAVQSYAIPTLAVPSYGLSHGYANSFNFPHHNDVANVFAANNYGGYGVHGVAVVNAAHPVSVVVHRRNNVLARARVNHAVRVNVRQGKAVKVVRIK